MGECSPSQVLFDYLQRELSPEKTAAIEAHLPHCAACRDEVNRLQQQIRQVRATLAQLDPDRPMPPQPDLFRMQARRASYMPSSRLAVAFTVAVVLILIGVLLPGEKQNALADSLSRLKVLIDVSAALNHTTSMDCAIIHAGVGSKKSTCRVRWNSHSITRVDRESACDIQQTLWISNTSVPPNPVWQPAMEFLTPTILAQHMERSYGLMQAALWNAEGQNEFLFIGRENHQEIELYIDKRTYLPKALRKFAPDAATGRTRNCVLEVQFLWNRPVPEELLIPQSKIEK
jgi:hypothetical protein